MDVFKSFLDLGLSGAALVALIVVIFKLLDVLQAMNVTISANTKVTEALKDSVEQNTEATQQIVSHLKLIRK